MSIPTILIALIIINIAMYFVLEMIIPKKYKKARIFMIETIEKEETVVETRKHTYYKCSDGKEYIFLDHAKEHEFYLDAIKWTKENSGVMKVVDSGDNDDDEGESKCKPVIAFYCTSEQEYTYAHTIMYEDYLHNVADNEEGSYSTEKINGSHYSIPGWYIFKIGYEYLYDYGRAREYFSCVTNLDVERKDLVKRFEEKKKDLDDFDEKWRDFLNLT